MTIHHSDVIYLWILMAVLVGSLEHELSLYRESLKMYWVYIAINLIVWYITIIEFVINYKLRRKK
jgi:hypothetical protein